MNAYHRGYNAGYAKAKQEAQAEIERLRAALTNIATCVIGPSRTAANWMSGHAMEVLQDDDS